MALKPHDILLHSPNKNLAFLRIYSEWKISLPNCSIHKRTLSVTYGGADKFLARAGRKPTRKHVRDALDFNKIEKRIVIKFIFLQGKAPKEIHAILTETLACFLPDRAKDLSKPLYSNSRADIRRVLFWLSEFKLRLELTSF